MNEGKTQLIKFAYLRVRLPHKIYKRFKLQCVAKDLSLAKQTEALIRKFVEIQEENDRALGKGVS